MAKLVLADVTSLANSASAKQALNDNFEAVEDAIENTLSRDGSTPNAMAAELDMGDHKVLNVADPVADADAVNLRSVRPLVEHFAGEIAETIIAGTLRVKRFIATSSQTDFQLDDSPGTAENMMVFDSGVFMWPGIDYTLGGSNFDVLSFLTGRSVGAEIQVRYVTLAPSDGQLRADLSATPDGRGAQLVKYVPDGVGAVARDLRTKLRGDVIHADDFGLVGDGTDETTKMQNFLNAAVGKIAHLGTNKTYGYAIATGISIPAGTQLYTHGSKFKRLTALASGPVDADFTFIINSNSTIDKIEVEAVGGALDIGGVIVAGSNVEIGTLKVAALLTGSGATTSARNAMRIGPHIGQPQATNIHIGTVVASNWDRPVTFQNTLGLKVDYVDITTYQRGLYMRDVKQVVVGGGHIRTKSPNALGGAGDNGVLIESLSSHFSTDGVRVNNLTVEDSAEHGVRIGGSFAARNIWFSHCHVYRAGSGGATATGGCGFKALGPTSLPVMHSNIHFLNCSSFDPVLTGAVSFSNFAGVQMGKVWNGSIVNFHAGVTPNNTDYTETGNSSYNGIELIGVRKITITNPMIQRPLNSGIYIYDFGGDGNDWGVTDDVSINGGLVNTPVTAGVEVAANWITMRRVVISALQVNGGLYGGKASKSGAGDFVNMFANIITRTPATESFNGMTDWVIAGQGNEVGSNACQNGSTFMSNSNGFRIRKAGAWVTV